MAVFMERCPACGGTIVILENASIGACDFCGTAYSLSELQKIRETLASAQSVMKEKSGDPDKIEHYESALDTSEADEISLGELCKKAEMALESEQWNVANSFSDELLRRDPKFAKAYLYKLLAEFKVFKKEGLANLEEPFDDSDNYRLLIRFADVYLQMEINNYSETVKNKHHAKTLENRYQALCRKLATASIGKHYQEAANGFRDLGDYKDSKKLTAEALGKFKYDTKKEQKKKTLKKLLVAIIILGVVFAVVGVPLLKEASYRAELFTVEVTDKVNVDYDSSNVTVVFKFNINNESVHDAKYLEGYITISDTQGTVLATGTTWFSGVIASQNKNYHEVSFDFKRDGVGVEIWNADISELIITYRITEIHFDAGTIKEYKGKDIIVNKP